MGLCRSCSSSTSAPCSLCIHQTLTATGNINFLHQILLCIILKASASSNWPGWRHPKSSLGQAHPTAAQAVALCRAACWGGTAARSRPPCVLSRHTDTAPCADLLWPLQSNSAFTRCCSPALKLLRTCCPCTCSRGWSFSAGLRGEGWLARHEAETSLLQLLLFLLASS